MWVFGSLLWPRAVPRERFPPTHEFVVRALRHSSFRQGAVVHELLLESEQVHIKDFAEPLHVAILLGRDVAEFSPCFESLTSQVEDAERHHHLEIWEFRFQIYCVFILQKIVK